MREIKPMVHSPEIGHRKRQQAYSIQLRYAALGALSQIWFGGHFPLFLLSSL